MTTAPMPRPGQRGWKKAMTAACRSVLNNSPHRTPLTGDADPMLRNLIRRHPEAAAKIGGGIRHFEVRLNGVFPHPSFWIIRLDGSETDFSFYACITPPSPRTEFAQACRDAVKEEIIHFKNSVFDAAGSVICPISGEVITRETAHIDHAKPWTFEMIVVHFAQRFADLAGLVEPTRDGEVATRFLDPAHAAAFRVYHAERATLRAVSRWSNLSTLRRGIPRS